MRSLSRLVQRQRGWWMHAHSVCLNDLIMHWLPNLTANQGRDTKFYVVGDSDIIENNNGTRTCLNASIVDSIITLLAVISCAQTHALQRHFASITERTRYNILICEGTEMLVISCSHFRVICDTTEIASYFEGQNGPNCGSMWACRLLIAWLPYRISRSHRSPFAWDVIFRCEKSEFV